MIYDPLYTLIKNTGISYLFLAIAYGFSFILVMSTILFISGGKKRVKEYLKDPLGAFIWPFFVVVPVVFGYLSICDIGTKINENLMLTGLHYKDFSLRLDQQSFIFWGVVTLSCIEGVENVIRYHKTRPNLWLSKPRFLQPISTVLFNIPLGIMVLSLFFHIGEQWITLHNFMKSGWLPNNIYNSDEMYGLQWLYKIVLSQIIIAVIASFSSLLILIREGNQKHAWIYKIFFLLCILPTGLALYTLSNDMGSLFQNVNSHFLNVYYLQLNQFPQFVFDVPIETSIQKLLLIQEITIITSLPKSMPLPNWLNGIIGIRLIVFIPEIYTTLAKPLGWKKFTLNASIKKILDFIK